MATDYEEYSIEQLRLVCAKQERELCASERENEVLSSRQVIRDVEITLEGEQQGISVRTGVVHGSAASGMESIAPTHYSLDRSTLSTLNSEEERLSIERTELTTTLETDITLSERENGSIKLQLREVECKHATHCVVRSLVNVLIRQKEHFEARLAKQRETHTAEVAQQLSCMKENIQRGVARELFHHGEMRCISKVAVADGGEAIYVDRETSKHSVGKSCKVATLRDLRAHQQISKIDFTKETLTDIYNKQLHNAKSAYAKQYDKILALDTVLRKTAKHTSDITGEDWFSEVILQCDPAMLEREVKTLLCLSKEVTTVTENCALLEFALEIVSLMHSGASLDYHSSNARELQTCRNELRSMRELVKKKRCNDTKASPLLTPADRVQDAASVVSGEGEGVCHVCGGDGVGADQTLARIKEVESLVDLCIAQSRLESSEKIKLRSKHYHDVRERELMITSYVSDIAVLRKQVKQNELLELELALYKKNPHRPQITETKKRDAVPSDVLLVSPPLEAEEKKEDQPRIRPASAPVHTKKFPVMETHWNSTGFSQPPIMKITGNDHLHKVTQSEQKDLVDRLYKAPLNKLLGQAKQERETEQKKKKEQRTLIGPESIVEVNQRLYYTVREADKELAKKRRQEEDAERLRGEPPPLTKASQGILVEKLYSKGVTRKEEAKQKLFKKLVLSQEFKGTKFTSIDEQNNVVNRLYARKT